MIFSCKDIKKSFGTADVLKSVSFVVEESERTALVGVNGAGKTTLFKIITGELIPDSGDITIRKGASIGYLAQISNVSESNTVYSELLTVFSDLIALEETIRKTEVEISYEKSSNLDSLFLKYEKLTQEFEAKKGFEFKSRIKGVIKGLGFNDEELEIPLSNLSGGQRTRVSLAKLLLSEPDFLLLDEPTNHLDIDSVAWLENYLTKNYSGSVLIISHDRYFLDKTVSKLVEIEYGVSKVYNGNYSVFAKKKEVDRDIQVRQYVDQQKEIKRQEDIIRRYRAINREWSVRKAESREKLLAKVERLDLPQETRKIRIMLEPKRHSGYDVLHIENAGKAFSEPLFKDVNIDIFRGETAALIGPNGVGKTTLLNMIMGKIKGEGLFRLGSGVKVGYYDQEQKLISDEKTIFDDVYDSAPNMKQADIRTALAAFVFCGDDVFKVIGTLSGGEKARVSLVKLMLGHSNFLIMDEPTNHLDMFSREILEEAIRNYTGTVLYVSHDRYFINNTADKIIELTQNGTITYNGNYDYYLEKKAERPLSLDNDQNLPNETSAKSDWKKKKDELASGRKRQSQINRIETEIAKIEKLLKSLEEKLLDDEICCNPVLSYEIYLEKTKTEELLNDLYEEWSLL